jgi:hypothetical protein
VNSIFLSFISLVYLLYNSKIKAVIEAAVHSEHGKVIQCEIKPGSVEKSIEVCLTAAVGKRLLFKILMGILGSMFFLPERSVGKKTWTEWKKLLQENAG